MKFDVQFDAITSLPSSQDQQRALTLKRSRQDRQARAAEVRRAQLLVVAWDMLKERGLDGFNMRELGLRAGYTAGAMYGYFASRDHILMALRERWEAELTEAVARFRLPRRTRQVAFPSAPSLPGGAQSDENEPLADALDRFLARSGVWWNHLTRDAFAVPLLLLPGARPEAKAPGGRPEKDVGWAMVGIGLPLDSLVRATQPCVHDLETMGWSPDSAVRLQREALCLGVGLAVLGVSPNPGDRPADVRSMAQNFRSALERWLSIENSAVRSLGHRQGGGQPDLFTG